MKAFYISLFVVLFFPLGLMGQTELHKLVEGEIFYIEDENDNIMCVDIGDNITLSAVKMESFYLGAMWQVVREGGTFTDWETRYYLKSFISESYLKYDDKTGDYSLVSKTADATKMTHQNNEWYLGKKTETETVTVTIEYVLKIATVNKPNDSQWRLESGSTSFTFSKSYNHTFYLRPYYDGTNWVGNNITTADVGVDEFKSALTNKLDDEGIKLGKTGGSIFNRYYRSDDKELHSYSFVGSVPKKKVSGSVNTSTKAFKPVFKIVSKDGRKQQTHEYYEVIYASNKNDATNPSNGDYSTVTLSLPVDGLATSLDGNDIFSNILDILGEPYYLSGFYRWYDYDKSGDVCSVDRGTLTHRGYDGITTRVPAMYILTDQGDFSLAGTNPGQTSYKIPSDFGGNEVIRIACDVSNFNDYKIEAVNGVFEITEPTLSYRVIYEIRHADEMRDKIYSECTTKDKFLETYEIIAPANKNIIIKPKYNCWGNSSNYFNEGSSKISRITDPAWTKYVYNQTTKQYTKDNRYSVDYGAGEDNELERGIYITAPASGEKHMYEMTNGGKNRYIAKFVVTGYDPNIVGPLEEGRVTEKNPEKRLHKFYPDLDPEELPKFDLKAELDFDDIYDANKAMYPNPLPWEDISAGFVYHDLIISGNKQREPSFVAMSEYALLSTTEGEGYTKRGSTLPPITNHGEDLQDNEKGNGYFLYVDATKKPSKVADLTINGDLCPNSKIYVSAWIANASNENSNYPNLNFVMMGVMTDATGNIISETQLSTFTTGEIQTKGTWQNVMFEFATTNVEYDKYRIRIESNNAAAVFGTGNDFAIDDIKIYMTSRTEASITQNRSCPAWNPINSDLNKSNVAILRADIVDVPDGDIYMSYTWLKQIGESADGNDVDVELLDLENYIDVTANAVDPNKIFGKIKVNKSWIEKVPNNWSDDDVKKEVTIGSDKIVVYKNTEAFFADNDFSDDVKASGYFFTIEGEGDDARIVLYIVHKSSLFQQFEEYCSIVTPINLDNYISEYKEKYADSDDEDALEALYNELKCGTRSKFEVLPYASIMLAKDDSNNYDFDFTQAVVKHLAKGQSYTFAVEAYYEDTEIKDDKEVKVMKPYNCAADWLLVTDDDTKWTDAQEIIKWRKKEVNAPTLSEGNTLKTSDGSVTSFPVNFSGPLHYIAIPDPTKAVDVDGDGVGDHTPCAIPVEIYLYDLIPATLANPTINNNKVDEPDRPAAICNEPIIVRIPNSLVKDNISLNLDIDYFDEYLFAEIAKYNEKENEKTQDKNLYLLNNIYLYNENKQLVATPIKFNTTITKRDNDNNIITLDLLEKDDVVSIAKDDDVTISGGHDNFESGKKYHFAGHNVVNGVTITPPFQFDVYVVPDEVVWTGKAGTAWHNDANWNPAFVPLSATNVRIPNTENKPVLNPSEDKFEAGANELLKHDIITLNSCKDIYFEAGAQLANQHMLNYERAFVDVPFTGTNFGKSNDNFKIMSFPLRNVYRGDLYIPKAGDGSFAFASPADVDNRAYNSFYVKAYDSAIKQNHVVDNKVESSSDEYNYENTSWSNPTSVLNFKFEEAHGYAVSLDAKINFNSETKEYDKNIQSFVRLPKSATEYYLWMDFGEGNEIELKELGSTWPTYEISEFQLDKDGKFQLDKDGKRIRSSEGHKLVYDKSHGASVTFENKKGDIFLIGNPFMTGLDVKAFLENEENKDFLEHKFYYQYYKGSIDVKMVDHNDTCTCVIPPFGAMFVKGKTDNVKQTFKFTPAMMSYKQSPEPSTQQRAPRMVEERELLTITAEVDGVRSRTYIEKDFAANNEYLDTEDADLLVLDADLTPISVYSVATGAALAYNSVTDMEFVPLGLLLVDSTIVAESVRFTFDGVDYFYDELYLYDALYNSYLPLIDGVALELEMPESGELRYFITDTKHNVGGGVTTSDDLVEGSKVCVFTTEGEACIIAEDIISEATVYDIAGRLIYYSDQISSSQHNISLPNGVYMLKVVVNSNLSTHKIILK